MWTSPCRSQAVIPLQEYTVFPNVVEMRFAIHQKPEPSDAASQVRQPCLCGSAVVTFGAVTKKKFAVDGQRLTTVQACDQGIS